MSLLALDWGQKHVGYASADPDGMVITPRGSIERKALVENTWKLSKNDALSLKKIVEEWEIEKIILGLPLKADGSESPASEGAKYLAKEIEASLKIEVLLVDERYTSWEAKGKDNHAEAAALILQNFFRTKEKS